MSTLDREPRTVSTRNDALHQPRIMPGTPVTKPALMPKKLPRGQDMTGMPKKMPVKR